MIAITDEVSLADEEISFTFVRASGPGGQNVNKVSSAVQLRFDMRNSPSLPDEVKRRLERLAAGRLTKEGVLLIDARRRRTQGKNRQEALRRLVDLIRKACEKPKPRKKTRTPAVVKRIRLQNKHHRSRIKKMRKVDLNGEM